VFEIAGIEPLVAAVGVDGRAALLPTPPGDPTTRLCMDRRTFTRLAGGRWTGADARAAGAVQVAGDGALADRVVDNLAFTI
jgi:hypothetical protein